MPAIPPERALVPSGDRSGIPSAGPTAQAGFLAQLIACRNRLGPYRTRRRAGAEDAVTCYRRDPVDTSSPALDLIV